MPLFLRSRALHLREKMDDPACDPALLHATYARFGAVNRLFSGWRVIYKRYLRAHMTSGARYRLLDIGFGGGDIPIDLVHWAAQDGAQLSVTAIDPDPRALSYARTLSASSQVHFQQAHSSELVAQGEHFDFVVSNHLLHHLSAFELAELCADTARLGTVVLHNDIARADTAYLGFAALTGPFFRGSLITSDGLTSVRRAYTPDELIAVAPAGWQVKQPYPYRVLLSYGI